MTTSTCSTVSGKKTGAWCSRTASWAASGSSPTFEDGFYGGGWYFTFLRESEAVTGFTMSTSRAWKVPFRKVG